MIFYQRVEGLLFIRNIEKNIRCNFHLHFMYIEKASPSFEQGIIKKYFLQRCTVIFVSMLEKLKINAMLGRRERQFTSLFGLCICGCKPLFYFYEMLITYYVTILPSKLSFSQQRKERLDDWIVCLLKFRHKKKQFIAKTATKEVQWTTTSRSRRLCS